MNKKGFTIIELLVVIAVFSVLIYVLTAMLINIAIAPKAEQSAIEQIDQARAVSNKFINEIRSAISCAGQASPISEAGDFQVIFCIDSKRGDENPQLDIDKIRYYKTGDTLYKGVTSPTFTGSGYAYTSAEKITTVLAGLVSNAEVATPTFYYYDGTYDGATGSPMPQSARNMALIQFVRINLPVIKQKINPSTGVSLTGWSHRKQITILNTNVDADLADFPLYVKIADDSLIGVSAKSDGSDIRFTAGDGVTLLQFEKESWTGGGGSPVTANFWVKTPVYHTPTATQNIIYIYYGNLDAQDSQDATAVWDSNYKGMWHFKEGLGATTEDSSTNSNTGTLRNSPTWTTGKIFNALQLNGTSQDVQIADSSSLSITGTGLTLSAWIYCNSGGSDDIIHKDYHYSLHKNSPTTVTYADSITWSYSSIGSYGVVPDNQWTYIVAVFNGSTIKFYNNGTLIGTKTRAGSLTDNSNALYIGSYNGGSGWFGGKIDEVRISSTARTAEWIKFEYHNMGDANSGLNISEEESNGSGNFLEYSTENSFTITGGATIRSLRSKNSFGQ